MLLSCWGWGTGSSRTQIPGASDTPPPRNPRGGRGEGRDPAVAGKGRGQTMEQYCQSGRQ